MSKVANKLDALRDTLTEIRDFQEEIPCADNECLCNEFDQVGDLIKDLRDKFIRDEIRMLEVVTLPEFDHGPLTKEARIERGGVIEQISRLEASLNL